ncbi:MAG: hypothetical protein FWE68_02390 [Defluviitaleaceae bacterium]|nr:hypothetical protein [Defluviitaleaceae bacterium]
MIKQKHKQKDNKKPTGKLEACHLYAPLLLIFFVMVSVFLLPIPLCVKMFFLGFSVAAASGISIGYYIFNK